MQRIKTSKATTASIYLNPFKSDSLLYIFLIIGVDAAAAIMSIGKDDKTAVIPSDEIKLPVNSVEINVNMAFMPPTSSE